jgi:hypothetical protein
MVLTQHLLNFFWTDDAKSFQDLLISFLFVFIFLSRISQWIVFDIDRALSIVRQICFIISVIIEVLIHVLVEATATHSVESSRISVFHVSIIDKVVVQVIEAIIEVLLGFAFQYFDFFFLVGSFAFALLLFECSCLMSSIFLHRSQSVVVFNSSDHRFYQLIKPVLAIHRSRVGAIIIHAGEVFTI